MLNIILHCLLFSEPPRITLNPTRQVVRRGDNAQIACTAEGDQPITITWSKLSSRSLPPTVQINSGLLRVRDIIILLIGFVYYHETETIYFYR